MRFILIGLVVLTACGSEQVSSQVLSPQGNTSNNKTNRPLEVITIATSEDGLNVPRDLEFHPDRPNELWVVNRATDDTVIFFDAETSQQRAKTVHDIYGMHFMEEVSSMAFGSDDTFATCEESNNTYNGESSGNDFMGPSLWPADLSKYGVVNQSYRDGKLGSHLDMLHQSPWCMGIAHDHDNTFWVFDGNKGHIVYYDFMMPHGMGEDDHSDGIVRRYPEASVTRLPDVPSHMELDQDTGWLYVADTGAGRVIRLDIHSGSKSKTLRPNNEPLKEFSEYRGATVETFVERGLIQPSGLALHGSSLFVSDYATGDITEFALADGHKIRREKVGKTGLMGITVDSQGRIWFVNGEENTLSRVDW